MTRDEILKRLRTTVDAAAPAPLDWSDISESTAIGDLGFDSLTMLDLIYDFQQAFGRPFDPQALVNLNTVGDLAAFLEKELAT